MERDRTLSFTPIDHPDRRVQRVGFDLTDPYVEQCWSAVVGPSSTLLLRRLPTLWIAQVPAEMGASDLSRSLGLGVGVGERSRLANTLDRLVHFGLARPSRDGTGFDVHRQVAPLSPRQLARVPGWTHDAHERLFDSHLARIDSDAQHRAKVTSIGARLDRLQHGSPAPASGPNPLGQGLGR
jgi:hypothetical protein